MFVGNHYMGSGTLLLLYLLWGWDPWDELYMSCLRVFMGWNVVFMPRGERIRLMASDVFFT